MRRFLLRPAIWGILLIVVLAAGTVFFLGSRLAREKAAILLISTLSKATHRTVTVGAVDFGFPALTFDVRDLVIPGPHPGDRPLVRVPFARVQLSWRALLNSVVEIEQIDVERPAFYLEVGEDGATNLPQIAAGEGGGSSRFKNLIGRVLVQNGTFRLNETEVPLTVDAKAVWGRLVEQRDRKGNGQKRYQVTVTAQEVTTALPDARPYAMSLSARALLGPGGVTIEAARVRSPELSGEATGEIAWGKAAKVDLGIDAHGQLAALNRLGYLNDPISGSFTAGSRYLWSRGQPWSYTGKLTSPAIGIVGRKLEELTTAFTIDGEKVRFDVLAARYHGGTATGSVTVEVASRQRPGRPIDIDMEVRDLSAQSYLAEQFPEQFAIRPPLVLVAARGSGRLRYRFQSSDALGGSGGADLRLVSAAGREPGLPLEGPLPLKLERGILSSGGPFHLTSPGQVIDGDFSFDLVRGGGQIDYRLASDDLGRLGPVWPPLPPGGKPDFWWPTAGRGTAAGKVEIEGSSYAAHIGLDLAQVTTPAMTADRVEGNLTLSPDAVSDLRLTVARGQGTLTVAGDVRLPPGKNAAGGLRLAIDASRFPLAAAAFFLPAGLGLEQAAGLASGRVDLGGDTARPTGRTHFEIEGLGLPTFPTGITLDWVKGDLTFDGDRVTIERGAAETPAGFVLVKGSLSQGNPEDGRLDLTVDAPMLDLGAEPLVSLVPSDLSGDLSIQAKISGTLAHPAARATIAAHRLALAGAPIGKGGAQAQADWDGTTLTASGRLAELLTFDGGGPMTTERAALRFDVRSADLGGLASLALPRPLAGLTGSLHGTLDAAADFAAGTGDLRLRLAELRGEYSGRRLVNLEPIDVRLNGRELSIERFYVGEPGGDAELVVNGRVDLPGPGHADALDLRLQSTLPLSWAKLAVPDLDIGGNLDVLATVRGTFAKPLLNGEGELRQGRLVAAGFVLDGMSGLLSFDPGSRQVLLEGLRARLGGGTLAARGWLKLDSLPDHPSYRLSADLRAVRFPLYGFNLRGSAQGLVLESTDEGRRLSGTIQLDQAFYVQRIEEVSALKLIRTAFARSRLDVPDTDDLRTSTQLALAVRSDDGALRINNNLADVKGAINLNVTGTLVSPIPSGKINLTPGGKLRYFDNEYRIERGSLTFNNRSRIDPVIDLVVRTKVQSYNLTVDISGTLERRLETRFSSDSNLPDLEILALLTTGSKPTEDPFAVTPLETEPQEADQQAARSILQGQLSSALSKRFGTLLGFDRFRIDPLSAENGQASSGIAYTVGKRLSKNAFVTYTRDPASTRRNVFQVELQVGKGVTVLLTQSDQEHQIWSVDIQWEKRF